jgi:hypothetical protein
MANRSYLYSTNLIPGPDVKKEDRKITGISEWNYDIPLVFKLLISGDPRGCPTSIWGAEGDIALVGDYALGVARLRAFLERIDMPEAKPAIEEALGFLNDPANVNQYFVLECGEIFEMSDGDLVEQNAELLENVRNLDEEMALALEDLRPLPPEPPAPPKAVGWLAKLFGAKEEAAPVVQEIDPLQSVYGLGLGNWANVLYFHFG